MALEIDNGAFKNQLDVLQALSTVDGELGKRLRESIFQELKAARNRIVGNIKFANGDPRGTASSVKRYVAAKYLGGVISILNGGVSSGRTQSYEPPRKLRPGQRGGNRRPRSKRTDNVMHYVGEDREFILRFVNSGTKQRAIERLMEFKRASGGSKFKWVQDASQYGNRGQIAPRNFFGSLGQPELERAAANLGRIIDEEFEKVFR